jgi:regulator of sigma E protease
MLITIVAFLFILAFSITIHEFGHFLIAKLFKIPVEKFSIGYGPPLIRKKIGETDFRIAYFPLGGYVKIAGEDEGDLTQKDTEETQKPLKNKNTEITETEKGQEVIGFYDAPIYQRVLIVMGGPVFNILSAVFVFFIIFWGFGLFVNPFMKVEVHEGSAAERAGIMENDSIVAVAGERVSTWGEMLDLLSENDKQTTTVGIIRAEAFMEKRLQVDMDSLGLMPVVPPILGSLKRDGPAHKAGMKSGNRVLKIDAEEIQTWNQMVNKVRASKNTPLHFVWQDNDVVKDAIVTPISYYDPTTQDTIGQIGAIMPLERRRLNLPHTITLSVQRSGEVIWLTLKTLYQLIIGRISRRAIGGPIAIAQLSGESARWGFESLLGLLAIISINLGLINLFPIPALDGGHIMISIIEAIRNKRFSHRTRLIIQQVGYAIILLLIVFVTFNDITR